MGFFKLSYNRLPFLIYLCKWMRNPVSWFSPSWQQRTTWSLSHSFPLVGQGGESEAKGKTHGLG